MDRSRVLDQDDVEAFISSLSDYQPTLPDSLVAHYLSRAGFVTDDVRIQRLIALATQKFLADIANDAIANSRLRADAAPAPSSRSKSAARDGRLAITVDDLERALREYGVNLRKPPYFADSTSAGAPEAAAAGPAPAPTKTGSAAAPAAPPGADAGAAGTPAAGVGKLGTPVASVGGAGTPTAAGGAAAATGSAAGGVSGQKPPTK